jgi:hypothetical protein
MRLPQTGRAGIEQLWSVRPELSALSGVADVSARARRRLVPTSPITSKMITAPVLRAAYLSR